MIISTITLQDLKDLIPRQLTGRYSKENFPVSTFNELSSHLEKYAETPFMKDEMIIVKEDGVTDYVLDDRVRQVRGLYELPGGSFLDANGQKLTIDSQTNSRSILPDKSTPVRFEIFGNTMRVDANPAVSDAYQEENRTILDGTGSTLTELFDIDPTGPLALDENLRGKGIIVRHANGVTDHLIIANSDNVANSLRVNGEMSVIPATGITYDIVNEFWMMEFVIYLPRVNNLDDVLGIPQDFEYVYRWGMFWYYYRQEGENKIEIDRYQRLFDDEKTRFASDQNRFRSDNFITKPRDISTHMFPPINF